MSQFSGFLEHSRRKQNNPKNITKFKNARKCKNAPKCFRKFSEILKKISEISKKKSEFCGN